MATLPATVNQPAGVVTSLPWLVRLRWLAVLGQLGATVVAAAALEMELDLTWLLALVGVEAASNAALQLAVPRLERRLSREAGLRLVAGVLAADAAILTGLLLASGGPMNPFSVFFLVQVALAGVLLGALGAWLMVLWTAMGFGLLFLLTPGGASAHAHHAHGASPSHLHGMWIAYVMAAGFVAAFVSGISGALARRERELVRLRERAEKSERLGALGAFSAGAAHELGTPLSTIAVVAADLASSLAGDAPPTRADLDGIRDDARLIRSEVERCRGLLRDLSERAGVWVGETPAPTEVDAVAREVAERLEGLAGGRFTIDVAPGLGAVALPLRGLVQSLVNLGRNALDASAEAVVLSARAVPEGVALSVLDRGPGLPPEVLARLGEPFVTEKGPGADGLGLGLHLVMAYADKVGGTFVIGAREGGGAVATLTVPRAMAATAAPQETRA
ncbi:MAG: HAMP domain-containing histidine kinase [Myxococcales bacterium]|nr:HAMP domain-containing histidine kinase [Myxococcales bacterium]MCB9732546.1 HAMP domain-containing histidine kinase [Deltaproteobacteria bacterium]